MPFNDEICKLVIENIELLEEAPSIIKEVEKKIFNAINKKFETFFSNRNGWKQDGAYTYYDDDGGETTFSSDSWPTDKVDEGYFIYYQFRGESSSKSSYKLSILNGKIPNAKYGIFFELDLSSLGLTNQQWKKILREKHQAKPQLAELGVFLEGLTLCIPIILDAKLIAGEYPDFDVCLKPVDDALDTLMKAHPYIDEIVQETPKINVA